MNDILIREPTPYQSFQALKEMLGEDGKKWKSVIISIQYNPSKGRPEIFQVWPFEAILTGEDYRKYKLRIYNLTVAEHKSESKVLEDILKYFDMEYNPDDIYTDRRKNEDGYICLYFVRG